MAWSFVSPEHEQAFQEAVKRVMQFGEPKSMVTPLYLLTAIPEVAERIDEVFRFDGGYFEPDSMERFHLSTGQRYLFALAMNLYNGYLTEGIRLAPSYFMGYLDKPHKKIVTIALSERYL